MNGLTKRWKLPESTTTTAPLRQRILAARGLVGEADRQAFLHPTLTEVTESKPLPGVKAAAGFILESVRNHRPIAIYGDYDVDGITSTAILWHVIRELDPSAPLETYVPHRLDEGYGLNAEAIQSLAQNGVHTVVTVDCGVTAIEEAAQARRLGLELIITDHHRVREDGRLPQATAIVHPSLPEQPHDFGDLCGAGVAWKLALELARQACGERQVSPGLRAVLMEGLSLAAMGTVADVVPLVGENRAITHFGLRHLANAENLGLRALLEVAGSKNRADAEVVGFRLGPRLNAAGRMGHAADAIELFTTADATRARELATALNQLNARRQEVERGILAQARKAVVEQGMHAAGRHAIVLRHPDWHPGVVGIVCSRLVEEFGRPALLLQDDGEMCRGSARSIAGYSIHAGLNACAEHLITFGGHDMAAGMAVASDQFDAFAEALTNHATAAIAEDQLRPELRIDTEALREELSVAVVASLTDLRPHGRANPAPRVLLRNLRVERAQPFGKTNAHLSLQLKTERANRSLAAVWWGQAPREREVRGRRVHAAGKLEVDDYRNQERLVIDDLAWADEVS